MENLFLQILNMSLTGSYVILAILLARLLLKKAPKKYSYYLWAVAAFRLICPVSFEAVFSLFKPLDIPVQNNAMAYVSPAIRYEAQPTVNMGIPAVSHSVSQSLPAATPMNSVNPIQIWIALGTALWCVGILAILIYGIISYVKLKKQLSTSVLLKDNVWQSETVRSPFILGFVKPKIYVPYDLDEASLRYVLTHERYHLRQGDHLVKPIAWLILTVHWFNPLVWLAFHLMGKDMEMRCDEQVLAGEGNIEKSYSMTLLSFAANRRFPAPSPLAFGESGVKTRIKNALRWKQPKVWMTGLAVVLCVAVMAACAANPVKPKIELPEEPVEAPAEVPEQEEPAPIDDPWGLVLTAEPTSNQTLTLTARQSGGDVAGHLYVTYGFFDLEMLENDKWVRIPMEMMGNVAVGHSMDVTLNGETSVLVSWEYLYGDLKPGRYRMTCHVVNAESEKAAANRQGEIRDYTAEFDLTGAEEMLEVDPYIHGEDLEDVIHQAILRENGGDHLPAGQYAFESHVILSHLVACGAAETDDPKAPVGYDVIYMMVLYTECKFVDNRLIDLGGSHMPIALTISTLQDGTFRMEEYWTPGDGSYYLPSLQEKFPADTHDQLDTQYWIEAQQQEIYAQAVAMGILDPETAIPKHVDAVLADLDSNELQTVQEERALYYYGDYTLRYIAGEFFRGDQEGERADLLLRIFHDLMGEEAPPYDDGDPQLVFNDWADASRMLVEQHDRAYLEETYPKTLLVMEQ